jgi:hypothetical protein
MLALASGLCATGYLLLRYASRPNSVRPTWATAIAAVIFGLVGAAITVFRLDIAWLPLLAPFVLLGAFAIATRPYPPQPKVGDS